MLPPAGENGGAGRWHRWHESLRGRGVLGVAVIASFPSPLAASHGPRAGRNKNKKSRCERAGDVLPSHTGLRCDGPSGRCCRTAPRLVFRRVFLACAAKAKPLQRVPAKSGGDASQSLTQRRKYIAQSGGRKKTMRLALYLPPVCRRVLVAHVVKTVGGGWLPGHTSTKKLANFTPAPLALIPTAPAAAITLSLTCTSSSRRKKSDSWLPRRENSSRPTRRGALRAPS